MISVPIYFCHCHKNNVLPDLRTPGLDEKDVLFPLLYAYIWLQTWHCVDYRLIIEKWTGNQNLHVHICMADETHNKNDIKMWYQSQDP